MCECVGAASVRFPQTSPLKSVLNDYYVFDFNLFSGNTDTALIPSAIWSIWTNKRRKKRVKKEAAGSVVLGERVVILLSDSSNDSHLIPHLSQTGKENSFDQEMRPTLGLQRNTQIHFGDWSQFREWKDQQTIYLSNAKPVVI